MLGAIWGSPLVASAVHGVPSSNYPHRGSFRTSGWTPRREKGRSDVRGDPGRRSLDKVHGVAARPGLGEHVAALAVGHRAGGLRRRRVRPLGAERPHPRTGRVPLPAHDRGHPGQRGGCPGPGTPRGPRARRHGRAGGHVRAGLRSCPPSPRPGSPEPVQSRPGGPGVAGGPARPEVHLRDLRGRLLEPPGPCGRPGRGRNARSLLQPPVHLRRLRAGQDPPSPRHRELRHRELHPPQGPLRHDRDVHERLRRLPAHLDHPGLQAPLPRTATSS